MEPINGNLSTSSSAVEPVSLGAAEQVGAAFCHQFYTTVSENRPAITKFYGHESKFYLEDKNVTGAQEIAKLYQNLPESTHFKIHSIKGYPTPHKQGVIINVVGTVNLRPFAQAFLLGQQGQKKYYIETDHFQYIDTYFDLKADQEKANTSSGSGLNGHVNGKVTKPILKAPEQLKEQPKPVPPKQQTPKKAEETARPSKQDVPKSSEKEVVKTPQKQDTVQHAPPQQQRAPAQVPVQEPVQEQPKVPKTWANLVGGGGKQQAPQQNYGQAQQVHQQQQMHHMQQAALHQQQQAQASQMFQQQRQQSHPANDLRQAQENSDASLNERKIYLGGITREIVPSNTAQAETEIKQVFYKYGEVEEVRMPRKVLDSPNDTSKHAFAFITMRNKTGVEAIFAAATRDEQGVWKLPLKLDAFGFDGHAQISEQRDQPSGGGFRGGRGGFQPRGGPFFRRAGGPPGSAPRGGLRNAGNFQNGGQH